MLDQLRNWKSLTREEKTALVEPMAKQGMSSSQIAACFAGVTRNSIIGHCSRYCIQLGALPGHKAKGKPKVRPTKPSGQKGQPRVNAIVAKAKARQQMPEMEPEPFDMEDGEGVDVTRLVGLLDLHRDSCRWPHGDPLKDGFGFCGAEAAPDKPYCPEHCAKAYTGFGAGPRP